MENETQSVDDVDFYNKLIRDVSQDWRKFEEVLLNDEYLSLCLLEENLDGFTQFLKENPHKISRVLIENLLINYGHYRNAYEYYYILRIIDLIVRNNPYYFSLFDEEYKDEQFVRKAFEANPYVKEYFTKVHCLYVSENPLSKLCCSVIKSYKMLKIFIGV